MVNKTYYKTKYELMNASLEDKINTCLYINSRACEQSVNKLLKDKNFNIDDIREKNIKIGALVEGEAFFHEKNQYYDVIGFMVESECEFRGNRHKTYGFRGIYFGKCDDYAPIDFDEAESLEPAGTIPNGLGDHVEILDVLSSEEEVNKVIESKNIDINHYLKQLGLLLPDKIQFKHKNKDLEK